MAWVEKRGQKRGWNSGGRSGPATLLRSLWCWVYSGKVTESGFIW